MNARTISIGLCLLMFSFSFLALAPIDDNNSDLSDNNDTNNVILPSNQTNIPGFQEGSIFTDSTLSVSDVSCVVLDNGSASCWGNGVYGQLGNGGSSSQSTPTPISSLGTGRTAVTLSSGYRFTCAILDNGSISCWGSDGNGQLGNGGLGSQSTPTLTSSLGAGRTAVALSAGHSHTCAILDNGSISCWGADHRGQLGNGGLGSQSTPTLTSSLGAGRTAVALSTGDEHTCAILDNGSVSCWGRNSYGELGQGGTSNQQSPSLTSSLGTGRTAVAISSGYYHTCVILDNGSVSCWGGGVDGQLGDGSNPQSRNTPTLINSLGTGRTAVAISSGEFHTCAILDNGSVSCWGMGTYGQLGNGGTSNQNTPTQTSSLGTGRTAVAISSGEYHTCAILDNSSVSCWGYGQTGEIGNGGTSNQNTPTLTSSLGTGREAALSERDFDDDGTLNIFQGHIFMVDDYETKLASGGGTAGVSHTCAILDNGSVSCWGNGGSGQLGNGGTSDTSTPTLTRSLGAGRTAVAISSGVVHTCTILDNGSVSCWGQNIVGQLGNGPIGSQNSPILTSSLGVGRTAVAISSGYYHTCVILDNGSVSCWGKNDNGQLGNGGTNLSYTPTITSSLGSGRTAVALSSGSHHTCAILDNGSVSCWGRGNYGQIGNGGNSAQTVPTLTSSLGAGRTAVAISSGYDHTCVVLDNGSVSCWGYGGDSQLGNGGTSNKATPTLTSSLGVGRTAVAISSGYHTCAILDNGSVSCWGKGFDGQLGNGGTSDKATPTLTSSLGTGRTALSLSSGHMHTCVILNNGSISCWGDGSDGQLGNGGTSDKTTPTLTSSLGTGRTGLLIDGDIDGDGALDSADQYPNNSRRSVSCSAGQYGRYLCVYAPSGKYVPSNNAIYATDASTGYYVDASLGTGQTSQTACSVGTYNPNTGSTSPSACIDASAGYYVGLTGQSSQTACSVGTYQSTTGQTSCDDASAGYYVDITGQSIQTACSVGTYQAATGQSSCDDATVGYYVDASLGTGQTSQTACSVGTYNPNTGSTSPSACIDASAGYYVDLTGQSSQTVCATGTYQAATGQSSCDVASAGYYVVQTGQLTQTACSVGTYQAATGQSSCDDASAGYYVDLTGQSSQTACAVGTYNPNIRSTSQSACIDASVGYYVDTSLGTGQASQTACSVGTYNPNTGSTSPSACIDASAGYYVDLTGQSSQTVCATGTYQAATGQSSCDDASAGYYVGQTGQSIQTACSVGTYNPNTGSTSPSACIDSSAGYYVDLTGQASQTACSVGTYQAATGQTSCDDASAGYYVYLTGQSSQTACPAGTYNPNTGSTSPSACIDASAGYYVGLTGQSSQIACSTGTYQSATGQTSCDDASAGYYVDASLGTGQTSQTACSVGTYNPNTGSTSPSACIDASAGYYVGLTGQSSQTACSVGTYQSTTGQTSCDDASAGYYVDITGQSIQTACSVGTYQAATGQSSCDDVDPGYYVDQMAQITQIPCSIGTYNPNTGSSDSNDCIDADAGYYVPTTAQSSQTACLSGTYNPNTGSSDSNDCVDADAGHHVPTTAKSTQTPCLTGTYQPLTGQSSCDDADAGYHVPITAQSSQTACSIGTFQAQTGHHRCFQASLGHYVPTTAQSIQTECLVGTFQPLTGQSFCDDAEPGYYVDQIGQISQIPCLVGTYNPNIRSISSSACIDADSGYYVDQTGQSSQNPCPSGTYNPSTGQSSFSCIPADEGYYVALVGQSNQTICEVGTYQPAEGSSVCENADIGYYVNDIGSIVQTSCPDLKSTIENSSTDESDCLRDLDSDLIPDIIDDDDDGDGFDDFDDWDPNNPYEWIDSDNDGEGDNSDPDDDNDGWSDVEEMRQGTNPLSSSDKPVDGFELIIPGTEISLGAWDLLGMLGGVPLFIWISFGLITRNNRNTKFENRLKEAKTKEELEELSGKIDLSLTLRLLGVHHGIRLEKLRIDLEDKFKQNLIEPEDQSQKSIPIIDEELVPNVSTPAEQTDDDGYEWLTHADGSKWYRVSNSGKEWIKYE